MKTLEPTDKFIITLTLPGGESNKGVKAFIYDLQGTDITPEDIFLTHIANGLYMNFDTTLTMPIGSYVVQAVVYSDNTCTTIDSVYGTAEEDYKVLRSSDTIEEALSGIYESIRLLKQADLELQFSDLSS